MSEMPLFERLEERELGDGERVFRVSEINRAVRLTLEDSWPSVLIEGELSDVRRAKGHVYFTLNDEEEPAQLRGVMFQSDVRRTKTPLENGARVQLRGKLSLYLARGQFQLIARSARPAGEGDLAAQFRRLRDKLDAEGLPRSVGHDRPDQEDHDDEQLEPARGVHQQLESLVVDHGVSPFKRR